VNVGSGSVICDFCGNSPAVAIHAVSPPQRANEYFEDLTSWAACSVCHEYILQGNERLHRQFVLSATAARMGMLTSTVERLCLPAVAGFWRYRTKEFHQIGSGQAEAPTNVAGERSGDE